MGRRPKHELTEQERYDGQVASRDSAGKNGRMRQMGWFLDAASYIVHLRTEDHRGRPPIAKLMKYLTQRGWKSERGKDVSRSEVKRMVETFDPNDSLPENKADWEAIRMGRIEASGGIEAASVAIDPEKWTEMQKAIRAGWKPTWRDRIIKADADPFDTDPQ
ncbi:hypothetical protein ASE49_17405 [Novosphingobium sp. Leaf2]|nr:hypothetical protein ASE49_17405 [Novosphingobium sp. Leaf2]